MSRQSIDFSARGVVPALAVAVVLVASLVLASGAAAERRGEPEVEASAGCTDGDGSVVVSLVNPAGSESVEFVVTDPRDGSTSTIILSAGEEEIVVLDGLANGAVTIPVIADGVDQSVTVVVACGQPGNPVLETTTTCVDGDGVVVVTVMNTAGDLPVHFFITDPQGDPRVEIVLSAGESQDLTFEGFADGEVTISVMADGADLSASVEVACDRPGGPEVTVSVVCEQYDGTVTVELANVSGERSVVFVVTGPRNGSDRELVIEPGRSEIVVFSGMADGSLIVPIAADGVDLPVRVGVVCDGPGIPAASAAGLCAPGGGSITVTVANNGGEGRAAKVAFDVASPGGVTTRSVRVGPGRSVTLDLGRYPDGGYLVEVWADGVALPALVVDVACAEPVVPPVPPVEDGPAPPPTSAVPPADPPAEEHPAGAPHAGEHPAGEPPVGEPGTEEGRVDVPSLEGMPVQALTHLTPPPDAGASTGQTLPATGSGLQPAVLGAALLASGLGIAGLARWRRNVFPGRRPPPTTVSA